MKTKNINKNNLNTTKEREEIFKILNSWDLFLTGSSRTTMEIAYLKKLTDELVDLFQQLLSQEHNKFKKQLEGLKMEKVDIEEVHKFYRPKYQKELNKHKNRPRMSGGVQSTAYDYSGGMVNGKNEIISEFNTKIDALLKKYDVGSIYDR